MLSDNIRNTQPFLPRNKYAQRGLSRGKMSVCLSARLSVTHWYSV